MSCRLLLSYLVSFPVFSLLDYKQAQVAKSEQVSALWFISSYIFPASILVKKKKNKYTVRARLTPFESGPSGGSEPLQSGTARQLLTCLTSVKHCEPKSYRLKNPIKYYLEVQKSLYFLDLLNPN